MKEFLKRSLCCCGLTAVLFFSGLYLYKAEALSLDAVPQNDATVSQEESENNVTDPDYFYFSYFWSPECNGIAYSISAKNSSIPENVVLPSSYNGIPVKAISDHAFWNRSALKSIIIPDSITYIGESAFHFCYNLTDVTIPDSVVKIGTYAFCDCRSFESMTIPGSVTEIGRSTFANCVSLKSVTIENGVTSIGENAFSSCYRLTEVTIPDSVTSIGDSAFSSCSLLTDVTIPDSVTYIGISAFDGCSRLKYNEYGNALYIGSENNPYFALIKAKDQSITSIDINANTKVVAERALCDLSNLTHVTIGDGVASINGLVFDGCDELTYNEYDNALYFGSLNDPYYALIKAKDRSITSVDINENTKIIAGYAFSGCSELTSVTIPGGVINIGDYAFSGCSALDTVNIPHSITRINRGTFAGCGFSSITISDSVTYIGYGVFQNSGLVSITIPDSVTNIDDYAFSGCSKLLMINIPRTITRINKGTFAGCGFSSITIPDSVTYIGYGAFQNSGLVSITIPDSVTNIDDYAFSGCSALDTVNIPRSITGINKGTFEGCGFSSITIPDSVIYIGGGAFQNSDLVSVTIPDSVIVIGGNAFAYCGRLTSITVSDNTTVMGWGMLKNCSSLTSIKIPFIGNSLDSEVNLGIGVIFGTSNIEENAELVPASLSEVIISDKCSIIPDNAFYKCSNIKKVVIGDGVTGISSSAFYGCTGLESITVPFIGRSPLIPQERFEYIFGGSNQLYNYLPESLREVIISDACAFIPENAFEGCSYIQSIKIGKGVDRIRKNAFSCTGLTEMTIPNNIKTIDSYAFFCCENLASVTISEGVTDIGDGAFYGCASLTEIIIPDSVINLGEAAFVYCGNLTDVVIGSGIKNIGERTFYLCPKLERVTLGNSVERIGRLAFSGSNIFSITFPESVSYIDEYAFFSCENLNTVIFEDSSVAIGVRAFSDCENLVNADLGKNAAEIGDHAFHECVSLSQINLGEHLEKIGEYAFRLCSNLENVSIPDSVSSIGYGAFSAAGVKNIRIPFVGGSAAENRYFGYIFGYEINNYQNHGVVTVTVSDKCTSIPDNAFRDFADLERIVISGSVPNIGEYAFYNCEKLADVNIPAGTEEIKKHAFEKCCSLMQITLPDSLTSIGDYAFYDCSKLLNITIPGNVKSIGEYAFSRCVGFTGIVIPDSVTSIGFAAIRECVNIESITVPFIGGSASGNQALGYIFGVSFPEAGTYMNPYSYLISYKLKHVTVTDKCISIPDYAFFSLDWLESITLPDGITQIGKYAFYRCTGLSEIPVPSGVTSIGEYAFYNCAGLSEIIIPDGVTYIDKYAFSFCGGITEIAVPDSVEYIGFAAFKKCDNITSITVPFIGSTAVDNESIGYIFGFSDPDDNLYGLPSGLSSITVTDKCVSIPDCAFKGCSNAVNISIPDTVTSIGDYAFYKCSSIKEFVVSDNVMHIGASAFYDCSGLEKITIPFIGSSVYSISGFTYLFGQNGDAPLVPKSLEQVIISEKCVLIPANAFYNCSDIKSITVPDSVKSIGESAFYNCKKITAVNIPDGITEIKPYTFYNCNNITEISIPGSVVSIGINAFEMCYSLNKVNISDLTNWCRISFDESHHNPLSWGNNLYLNNVLVEELIIPDGVLNISDHAFCNCKNIKSVIVPNSVTNIGYNAFGGCDALTSITVPFIGESSECGNQFKYIFGISVPQTLEQIVITGKCMSIPQYAFEGCGNVLKIELPDDVTSIGYSIFQGCSRLTSITVPYLGSSRDDTTGGLFYFFTTLPDTLKEVCLSENCILIPNNAFYGCSSIERITVSDKIKQIGRNAFYGCDALQYNEYGDMLYLGSVKDPYIILMKAKNASVTDISVNNGTRFIYQTAFDGCTGLLNVFIPDSVEAIQRSAFEDCVSIRSLTLPFVGENAGGNESLGFIFGASDYSGKIPDSLTRVVLLNTCTKIPEKAFYNCSHIDTVILPDSLLSIGSSSFLGCSGLTEITVPSGVTEIGASAFFQCSRLESITLPFVGGSADDDNGISYLFFNFVPSSLKRIVISGTSGYIKKNAFVGCSEVESIIIPESVTSIGECAFSGCRKLKEIRIPHGASIKKNAFLSCYDLKAVYISDVAEWCMNSFETVESNPLYYGCYLYLNDEPVSNLVIPDSVTYISDYAFYNCKNLTGAVIPDSVVSIGASVFYGCSSIESITVPFIGSSASDEKTFKYFFDNTNVPESLKYVVISSKCNTVPDQAFRYCGKLISVTISEGVSTIGAAAFGDCSSLTQITVPNSVTSIGGYAFSGCSALKNINIPSGLTRINENLFYGCKSLTSAVIPVGVTDICDSAFRSCIGLLSVTIPEGVVSIGSQAFNNCTSLTDITIPDSTLSIGFNAFGSCSSLICISVPFIGECPGSTRSLDYFFGSTDQSGNFSFAPASLKQISVKGIYKTIQNSAFIGNKNLERIILSSGITDIGDSAFKNCTGLVYVSLPDTLTTVGEQAFYGCSSITNINLPDTVTVIKESAFSDCRNLININIPDGVTEIKSMTFSGCRSLLNIPVFTNVESIGDHAFSGCTGLICITVPDSVLYIDTYAFSGCTGITCITVSDNVISIGKYAFRNCSSIASITLPFVGGSKTENQYFGYIFGADNLSQQSSAVPESLKRVVLTGCEPVFDNAFQNCSNLEQITISGSIETIGKYAFRYCSGLKRVSLPKGLKRIDDAAFYGCRSLEDILIPEGVISIGDNVFNSCSSITSAVIPDTVTEIGTDAFDKCTSLKTIYISDITKWCAISFSSGRSNPLYHIDNLYVNNEKTVDLAIPDSVSVINAYAFYGCSFLTGVSIPESITSIGVSAFAGCVGLKAVRITDIAKWCNISFYGSVSNPVYYAKNIYLNDTYISELVIPATVAKISSYAFYGCRSLSRVTIPDSVSKICEYAFGDCSGVSEIVFNGTLKQWDHITKEYNWDYWNSGTGRYTLRCTVIERYTVRFVDHDGSLISERVYSYKNTVIAPENPVRDPDETYTYEFSGWYPEITAATENITYTASYTPYYIDYIIRFVDHNGTVLSEDVYHYGDSITVADDPLRPADNTYTYAFSNWDKEITPVSGSTTYTAVYIPSYINYTVRFVNYDNTIIEERTYHYGDDVTVPNDPTKPADKTYTYTFDGWNNDITAVSGDAEYKATYRATYIDYTVKFVDYDGTKISEKTYHYGDNVTIPANPTRAADNTYTYTFKEWDKPVTNVTENATYTAVYKETYIDYTVTFKNYDGSIIKTTAYHYGDDVAVPANPNRAADNTYTYSFKSWDKDVTTVTGNTEYTATYTPTYIEYTVRFVDYDDTELSSNTYHYGDTVTAPANPTREKDGEYTYTFSGWDKDITQCKGNEIYRATYTTDENVYTVTFKNYDGSVIAVQTYLYNATVKTPSDPTRASDNTYTYTFNGWDKEVIRVTENAEYTATYKATYIDYTVKFVDYDGTVLSEKTYHYGDTVTVPSAPTRTADNTYTYAFKKWDKPVTTVSGDTTYTATYTPTYIDYTVKFVDYDGTVISEKAYHYGEEVDVPKDPIREEDDKYTYIFKGWDKDITIVMADAKYTATYDRVEKPLFVPGDINGDGQTNNKDIVALFRYVSGGNVDINEIALDVNGDGSVNNKDVTILFRYVSGSPVTISDKPYTPKMSAVMIAFIPSKSKSDLIV